ncbi:hypothetical protein [Actinocatenispora sera]|jgi:hypothetical protein|uniref:Uncharacterized protein n=1 Tax=Actinocatenispora sera TaxID=390989 RepID=A0A810L3I0_9ACTN|nr:hypothetical protein [Actinocatenispora sera]BCJ29519.1 hypothetical protein Asera_36270 [Actinocatenispora sera]
MINNARSGTGTSSHAGIGAGYAKSRHRPARSPAGAAELARTALAAPD